LIYGGYSQNVFHYAIPSVYSKRGIRGFSKRQRSAKKNPLIPLIKIKGLRMNTNTKNWSFTWGTTINKKKLTNEVKLVNFFNVNAEVATFQYELGEIRKKEHIQGMFTIAGPRQSKSNVLKMFEVYFQTKEGLTISPVYDRVALNAYVTKEAGRTKGPFYAGKNEMYDKTICGTDNLRSWQKGLFEILTGPEKEKLKDRKVIWVEDVCGNTGKSWFQKWLRIGQKQLEVRQLPVSSVDRLISAVNIVSRNTNIDVYTIDLTRTKGEDQSYKDLFSAIEQIKNGYVVDVMYGKYNEAIFKPPMIIIFTNHRIDDYYNYLSRDRWEQFTISSTGDLLRETVMDKDASMEDINANIKKKT
jgi:hypothetical protein